MGSVGQQFLGIEPSVGVSAAGRLFGGRPASLLGDLERALARDVFPRLTIPQKAAAPGQALGQGPISHAEVIAFAGLARANDLQGALDVAAALRSRGLNLEVICDGLIAPAARHLGELWVDDHCDCVQVTIATGLLHQVLRSLAPPIAGGAVRPDHVVLLVPVPGEQHMLGLAMVCTHFRSHAWQVRTGTPSMGELGQQVRAEWFAVVGFSLGSEVRLETLRTAIRVVRDASCNPDIGILVGGKMFVDEPALVREIGADATAADGSGAVRQAERLLQAVPART